MDDRITELVDDLANWDGMKRQAARKTLVQIGTPAIGALIEALGSDHTVVRWEAAKALGVIGDLAAAPALTAAMNDSDFGVRWLAAEGLIELRGRGLAPLLEALMEHPGARWLWESAHHVFKVLADEGFAYLLAPVLDALGRNRSPEEISLAARRVLFELRRQEQSGGK